MAHPAYIRDKARALRTEKHLSIDEIAHRLALPKTTIYHWVRDLPLGRPRRANPGQRRGSRSMQNGYALRRAAAYLCGRVEFDELVKDPTFRDFVCLYIAEGYKRNRNQVAVGNSDPAVVALCTRWLRRFARNRITFSIQYHADQNLRESPSSGGAGSVCRLIRSGFNGSRTAISSPAAHGARGMAFSRSPSGTLNSALASRDGSIACWSSGYTRPTRGVAQSGSASGLGPEGRRFKSGRPDFR
jgi:hypothetical protein